MPQEGKQFRLSKRAQVCVALQMLDQLVKRDKGIPGLLQKMKGALFDLPPIYVPLRVRGFTSIRCAGPGASALPERREAVGRPELRQCAANSAGVL